MGTRITYTSPGGKRIVLLQPGGSSAALAYEGLDGLIGQFKVSTRTTLGIPGEQITSRHLLPMKGSLTLLLDTRHGQSIEELETELRSSFLPAGPDQEPGTLMIERPRRPRARAKVFLDGHIQAPREVPEDAIDAEYVIPLVSYEPPWTQDRLSGHGTVTVTNTGETFLWPTIRWYGPGRKLTLPSGLQVTLPTVPSFTYHRLSLDPYTSHEVTNSLTGDIHPTASTQAGNLLLGEGIPPKQTRTYITSSTTAHVEWAPQIRDPWR